MEVQSAFQSGLEGFKKATDTANQAAADIVAATSFDPELSSENVQSAPVVSSSDNSLPDLSRSIVELKVAEHQAKASAKVIKSADENLGTLLDVSV